MPSDESSKFISKEAKHHHGRTYIQFRSLLFKYMHGFFRLCHCKRRYPILETNEQINTWNLSGRKCTLSIVNTKELFFLKIRKKYSHRKITLEIPAFSPAISPRVFPVNKIQNKLT